eukprot:6464934-Amphidinium_carterae.1
MWHREAVEFWMSTAGGALSLEAAEACMLEFWKDCERRHPFAAFQRRDGRTSPHAEARQCTT